MIVLGMCIRHWKEVDLSGLAWFGDARTRVCVSQRQIHFWLSVFLF